MFLPLPMQRVELHVLSDEAPAAVLALAELGVFNPEAADSQGQRFPDAPAQGFRELYGEARSRLDKLNAYLGIHPVIAQDGPPGPVEEAALRAVNEWLLELWVECSKCEERQHRIHEEMRHNAQLDSSLDQFAALDIDLGRLQERTGLLDLHVGTIPAGNIGRLRDALGLAGYLLTVFLVNEGIAHVVIAGTTDDHQSIKFVLESAGWHPLEIPAQFSDHPEVIRRKLAGRRHELEEEYRELEDKVASRRKQHLQRLTKAARTLAIAAPYAELAGVLRGRGGLARLGGWVPRREMGRLREALQGRLGERFEMSARDPLPEELALVPSAIPHLKLLHPFLVLVKNFGIPRYGEVDPTIPFALTFIAMYGMMFGDIGHGSVIAAVGIVLRRKLFGFAPFVIGIGLSSVAFGFVYGSLFGYEGVVHPVWMSPLDDPMLMLQVALYWGIGFIVLATMLTIRNRLVERRYAEALFDGRGLAGLLFYLGLLYAGYNWATTGGIGWPEKSAMVVPLLGILAYQWREHDLPTGERLIVVFIEGFETVMSYIANSMSFLRVAAFSLNHVALAIAILTLADMLGTAGHWLTVLLGNLFVLVFEGAIVAIQVLRLEYYEGFARFFSGDGREFRPLTLLLNETNTRAAG